MSEFFHHPSTEEGNLFNNPTYETLRKHAFETNSPRVLSWVHDRLVEKAFEDPTNEQIQNTMMHAFLRLETFSEFESLTARMK